MNHQNLVDKLHDMVINSEATVSGGRAVQLEILKVKNTYGISKDDFNYMIATAYKIVDQGLMDTALAVYKKENKISTYIEYINDLYKFVLSEGAQASNHNFTSYALELHDKMEDVKKNGFPI